jgi:hypothetical protein
MRIAFDLDGVLADLHTAFSEAAVQLFPELDRRALAAPTIGASPDDGAQDGVKEAPDLAAISGLPLSRRQSEAVWDLLGARQNFWQELAEIESGAIRRLAALADERRWEVLFITSRPKSAGATVQRQSQEWLQRMGFPMPSAYVVHGSRGRVAAALNLDVVIDDRPDNCLDVVLESKAGAILIWRGPEAAVPASARRLGIAVAPTVAMCLDLLVEAEAGQSGGSMLDRIRGVFGLKTRAASTLLRR